MGKYYYLILTNMQSSLEPTGYRNGEESGMNQAVPFNNGGMPSSLTGMMNN